MKDFDPYLPADHDWVPHASKCRTRLESPAKPVIAFFYPFPTLTYVNGHLVRVKDETRYGNPLGEGEG